MRSLGLRRNVARRAFQHENGRSRPSQNVGVSRLRIAGNDELVVATDFKSVEGGQDAAGPFTGGPYHNSEGTKSPFDNMMPSLRTSTTRALVRTCTPVVREDALWLRRGAPATPAGSIRAFDQRDLDVLFRIIRSSP